jgi:dihydropteroate synthase
MKQYSIQNINLRAFNMTLESKTQILGILNVTPDSFFDGGRYQHYDSAVARGLDIEREGADIIDIGGESTRPYALDSITEEEELARVIPVIETLHHELSIPISIDTNKSTVMEKAIEAGASIVNDVHGFSCPKMREIAAQTGVKIIIMHMQGSPKDMQKAPEYPLGVTEEIMNFFTLRIEELKATGVKEQQIIVDPGIGFGKTVAHNIEIIENIQRFKSLGFPLLLGLSYKSFMKQLLNKGTHELHTETLAINTLAIKAGVDLIRVHDVKEHRDIVDLFTALTQVSAS